MLFLFRNLPFYLLIFLIGFTPISFGGVHVWAYSIMEFATLIIVSLALINTVFTEKEFKWIKTPLNAIITIYVAYLVLQIIPMPKGAIAAITPGNTYILERFTHVFQGGFEGDFLTTSLIPYKSWSKLLKIISYLGIILYIINYIHSRKQINIIVIAIAFVGIFEAISGWVLVKSSSPLHIGPFSLNTQYLGRFHGSYISPNHLAGYFEMAIFLIFGALLTFYGESNERNKQIETVPKAQRMPKWVFQGKKYVYPAFLFTAIGMMLTGLFLTGSRGGLLGFFAGIMIIILLTLRSMMTKLLILLLSLTLLLVILFGIDLERQGGRNFNSKAIERLQNRDTLISQLNSLSSDRVDPYLSMLPIVKDFSLAGTGLGTFQDIFIRYKPDEIRAHISHAHSDWLELLIETGFIGFTLVLVAVILYFSNFIRLWRQRKDSFAVGMGLGVLGSSAAILTHSLVDFNFQIPANALLFAVILGVGYSSINNQNHQGMEVSLAPFKVVNWTIYLRVFFLILSFPGIFFVGKKIISQFLSEQSCPTQYNSTLTFNREPSISDIKKGLEFAPDNSECMNRLVKKYRKNKTLEPMSFFNSYYSNKNIELLKKAIRLNPTSGNYYLLLGEEFIYLSQLNEKDRENNLGLAIKSLENAQYFKLVGYEKNFKLAAAWLDVSEQLPDEKNKYSEVAIDLLQKTLLLSPYQWKEVLKIAVEYFAKEDVLNKVFPPSGTSTQRYGESTFNYYRNLGIRWLEMQK